MASSSHLAYNASTVLQAISGKLDKQWRGEWDYANFVNFMGSMTMDEALMGKYPSGLGGKKPIVMVDNPFAWKGSEQKGGGNRWGRAEKQALTGSGVSGDTSIEGTGVMPDLLHAEGYINAKRFITRVKSGIMTKQNLGAWAQDIYTNGAPELYDLANRYASSYGIRDAIFRGYSRHIRGSGTNEFGITTRWHPNLCVPGLSAGRGTSGEMFTTWSATTATFEGRLAKKVAQVTSGAEHQMSVAMLEKLAVIARRNVRPMFVRNGKGVYGLELDLEQMAQLRADNRFESVLQNWPGGNNQQDVFFEFAEAKYGCFFIFDTVRGGACPIYAADTATAALDTLTEIGAGGVVTSANALTLHIGPQTDALAEKDWTSLEPDDLSSTIPAVADPGGVADLNRHCGIVWGEAAIYGVNVPIDEPLTRDLSDHKTIEDIALARVFGFSRYDLYNDPAPASATTVRSNRCMPFVTYSPTINL